jgi:hypothetical protein
MTQVTWLDVQSPKDSVEGRKKPAVDKRISTTGIWDRVLSG